MCVQTGVRSSELAEQAGVRSHPPPRCGCFHRGRVDSGARFLAIRPHVGLLIREDPAAAAGGFFAFFAIFFALPVSSPSEESVSESVSYSSPKSFSEEGDDEDEDDEPAGDGEGRKDMGGMEDGEGGGEEVVGRVRGVAAAAGGLWACTGVAGTREKVGQLYQNSALLLQNEDFGCTTPLSVRSPIYKD